MRDIIFEAILSMSERYKNIQDNRENDSVLPFRIIPKNFAVNILCIDELAQSFDFASLIGTCA